MIRLQRIGLPHSDIRGSTRVCQSPRLFAAYHVLRRFREPRHPPFALSYFLRHTSPFCKTSADSFSFLNNVNELFSLSGIVTVAGFTPIYCLGSFEATAKYYLRVIASRKEVFQPHLPVRLPCYDLAPITSFTLGRSLRSRTSGTPGFHGLTGGVYKARERIHRAVADARLLANPASWSRVTDSNPN